MGLCDRMRVWRWRGSAGALRAGVGAMLLGLSLAQSDPPQPACVGAVAPQSLTQPEYQGMTDAGVGFMTALLQSFLHTVQPKPFPGDLIFKFVENYEQVLSNQEVIKEALLYEVGFLVCAAIGILYIVLMPAVGFFLACCRCCGNCGGKMYQKQTSSIRCRRRTLYWCTFVTTIIIFAGNVCMFKSNQALKISVDQSPAQLNTTIKNINTFVVAVPQQIHYVLNEGNKTVGEVTRNLDDIGYHLGKQIQQQFSGTLGPALHLVGHLNKETGNTSDQLNKLNSSLARPQSSMDHLQANVTAIKNRINETLSSHDCLRCSGLRIDLPMLDTSITIPGLIKFQSAVDELIKSNLTSKIEEVEDYFNSIPSTVTTDTSDVVQRSKKLLDDIEEQISQITSEIQLSGLSEVSGFLDQAHTEINRISPDVKKAEYIRWAVCITLCCVVLLVVVCNLLGLILGPAGLTPSTDPTNRSCTADCGGTFLMMGAGFSFLFSWLFMIVVLLLFLLGGNVFTLVCRPWNNGRLLKFIDRTSNSIPELSQITQALATKGNFSFYDIYRDCDENKPLWATLHLDEIINLDNILNVSKYTDEIQQQFESTTISLSSFTLLSPEVKNQLSNFSSEVKSLDSAAFMQQMNSISTINLNETADQLEELAANQPNANIKEELQNEAKNLRQIQADIETIIIPQLENLNSTIESLRSDIEKINGTVGEVLSNVEAAQDFLNTNTTQIVKTESRNFLDCQLEYFSVYAHWANLMITQEVGRCRPVSRALDSAETILCSNMVESLNAFWFSLGWCLIFFIPSIILSVKLAKYYRKMKYTDSFDNHIVMNQIPRAQMKIT